uniref:Uncharacterized protein n=1 Tax=Oryza brachyantha TaxID=4533 RepID=J3M8U5_ORYBR
MNEQIIKKFGSKRGDAKYATRVLHCVNCDPIVFVKCVGPDAFTGRAPRVMVWKGRIIRGGFLRRPRD